MKETAPNQQDSLIESARAELLPRVVSSGGRPTNPDWDMRRTLPLSASTYEVLQQVAEALSTDERVISPMQVAAFAVEKALLANEG